MNRLKRGGIAGFLATAPMTAAMEFYRRGVPATARDPFIPRQVAEGISRRIGFDQQIDEFGEPGWWALTALTHFGFGGVAGALYGLFNSHRDSETAHQDLGSSKRVSREVVCGVGFGLLIWVSHYLALFPALGLIKPQGDKPVRKNAGLILSHLVWGITTALVYDSMAALSGCSQSRLRRSSVVSLRSSS